MYLYERLHTYLGLTAHASTGGATTAPRITTATATTPATTTPVAMTLTAAAAAKAAQQRNGSNDGSDGEDDGDGIGRSDDGTDGIAATCPPSPATDTSDSGVRVLALMRVPWTQNARRAKCEARKASAYEKRSIDAQIVPQCRQGKCRQHVMSLDTFECYAGVPVEA